MQSYAVSDPGGILRKSAFVFSEDELPRRVAAGYQRKNISHRPKGRRIKPLSAVPWGGLFRLWRIESQLETAQSF